MTKTLLAALAALALAGCSHAKKETVSSAETGATDSGSVAQSGDERVEAQESRDESGKTVYDGPAPTGGSAEDTVARGGEVDRTDNAPNQGEQGTQTRDEQAGLTGTGGQATRATSELTEQPGTGGSGQHPAPCPEPQHR